MTSALVEAKALCNDQILDVLSIPMFTIFKIQHDQIADRVDSDNKLLYHFKQSMARMKEWNSSVVHDFCSKLVKKFPAIQTCDMLAREMIKLTCKILDESHDSEGRYVPTDFVFHDVLHAFIVECSKIFIEYPEWFSHDADSTEYQTCLNNARIAMKNRDVVYNATRKYVTLTIVPVSPSSSSSCASSSSPSSPSSQSSPTATSFAGAEPVSASGIYLTPGDKIGSGDVDEEEEEESVEDMPVNQHQVVKNINVVTGDVETVSVPKSAPVPSFPDATDSHGSNHNTLYPGSMNSSSVYPSAPNPFPSNTPALPMPPPNLFAAFPTSNLFAAMPPKEDGNSGKGSSSYISSDSSGEEDYEDSDDNDCDDHADSADSADSADCDAPEHVGEDSSGEDDGFFDHDYGEVPETVENRDMTDGGDTSDEGVTDSSDQSESESESDTGSDYETGSAQDSELEIDSTDFETETDTDTVSDTEADTETDASSDTDTYTETDETGTDFDTETDSETDGETESESVMEIETDSEDEYDTADTEAISSDSGSE